MARTLVALVVAVTLAVAAGAPASAAPFDWQLDSATGHAVAQLTEWGTSSLDTQDNYALYYHQGNQPSEGDSLVYRHTECGCNAQGQCATSASSVEYRRLDLETGAEVQLYPTGLANGADVHGGYLYISARDTVYDPFERIERIDLDTLAVTCLTPVPSGEEIVGSLTVNADGTEVIYQTRDQSSPGLGSATWVHEIASPTSTCPGSNTDTLLHGHDTGVEHVVFSPTNTQVFTFIDQNAADLARLGIGTTGGSGGAKWNNLESDLDYLYSFTFAHPFWAADGHLWSDAINPLGGTGYSESFVRFTLDDQTGWVSSYAAVATTASDWHHHQGSNRSLGWFVGDGQNLLARGTAGQPYVSLFHLDPPSTQNTVGGQKTSHFLADSLGGENSGVGNGGVNAHLLETLDGAVFTAPYDFDTGESSDVQSCQASRNVFLVKIPNRLKAGLDDTVIGGSADGPWKHAHRLSVSPGGTAWEIDYGAGGATPTLGDGVLDHTAGRIAVGPYFLGLADLDGDDVDDRLAYTPTYFGWKIDLSYSPYDGVLPTGNVTADTSRVFNTSSGQRPIFGDLDGDGRDDLVMVDDTGASLQWQGLFSDTIDLPAQPYTPFGKPWETASAFGDPSLDEHVFVGDVDGDGYADRVTARPYASGWQWRLDLSSASGFGDGVVDDTFIGGAYTDTPLLKDVNADGRADIVIAREQSGQLRWYVNPSSGGGLGNAWDPPVGRGFFGNAGDQPLLGHFGRFYTVD